MLMLVGLLLSVGLLAFVDYLLIFVNLSLMSVDLSLVFVDLLLTFVDPLPCVDFMMIIDVYM